MNDGTIFYLDSNKKKAFWCNNANTNNNNTETENSISRKSQESRSQTEYSRNSRTTNPTNSTNPSNPTTVNSTSLNSAELQDEDLLLTYRDGDAAIFNKSLQKNKNSFLLYKKYDIDAQIGFYTLKKFQVVIFFKN